METTDIKNLYPEYPEGEYNIAGFKRDRAQK